MTARLLTFTESIEMVTETCCTCGLLFAMTSAFTAECRRQTESKSFYCPNGHGQWYTGESSEAKTLRLQKELEAAKLEKQFTEQRLVNEQLRHSKELKRIERRSHAGVCQKCHRTFNNVARHMKSKHSV